MAEKAYPKCSSDKQQEMARNRFIQAIQSPSIQLLLMKEQPDTLDGALMLARRQLSVEVAQKNLSSTKNSHHLAPIVDKSTSEILVAPLHGDVKQQEQLAALSKQLQQLTLEMNRKGQLILEEQTLVGVTILAIDKLELHVGSVVNKVTSAEIEPIP